MGKGKGESGSSGTEGPGKVFYGVLAAVVVAGGVALYMARGGGEERAGPQPVPVSTAEADPAAGVAAGPEDAPVTIMEFVDFQCPHCAQFYGFTGRLIKQNYVEEQGLVRWIFYDFPLGSFPNSIPAAVAARCAGDQGRFWAMHDRLLARQSEWGRMDDPIDAFVKYARNIGLQTDRFRTCVEERRHLEEIRSAKRYGEQLGVRATPTIFLNGEKVPGTSLGYEALARRIEKAAAAQSGAGAGESGGSGGGD